MRSYEADIQLAISSINAKQIRRHRGILTLHNIVGETWHELGWRIFLPTNRDSVLESGL
jgi:hypothetical protein